MIGYLSGTVRAVRKNYIILATDYVGYKVFVTPQVLLSMEQAKKISLFIYTHVREDVLALYGFSTLSEQEMFEMLISVSGIGPRMAMSIMSVGDLAMIRSGIINGDAAVFTKVSGVGRKTAERLIVELKERIAPAGEDEDDIRALSRDHADVLDVLEALGYSKTEARSALAQIPKEITESQEKIREALRSLAKQ